MSLLPASGMGGDFSISLLRQMGELLSGVNFSFLINSFQAGAPSRPDRGHVRDPETSDCGPVWPTVRVLLTR